VETNRRRSREEMEYELLDTGIFDQDRYFDVFVEYAKADPEDTLIRFSVHNRGSEAAHLHLLPTLWFRNTWSWGDDEPKPVLGQIDAEKIHASHPKLGDYTLQCEGAAECSSPRTNPMPAVFGDSPIHRPTSKMPFTNTWSAARGMLSVLRRWAPKPQRITRWNYRLEEASLCVCG
jgi:hypothetical protein